MARTVVSWLSSLDLARRLAAGRVYQLSATTVGDEFFLYYRREGAWFWHPLAEGRKKKQISYKIENLIGLIRRVRPLNCPFEFILDGERYSNCSQPLTSHLALEEKYAALNSSHRGALLSMLCLPNDVSVQALADRILFGFAELDSISQDVVRRILNWPDEVFQFDNSPRGRGRALAVREPDLGESAVLG
jgi:hypothetical protein